MKYKVSILFTFIVNEQEYYDSLIEEGYLPDEAKHHIKNSLYEIADRLDDQADNIIDFPYMSECEIKEID